MIKRTIVLAILAHIHTHPGIERTAEPQVVDAIAAVAWDVREAAYLATWCAFESGCTMTPRPQSPDARAGHSVGPWQTPAATRGLPAEALARYWLDLVGKGESVCPGHPLEPLSGGCRVTRALVERRIEVAEAALREALGE